MKKQIINNTKIYILLILILLIIIILYISYEKKEHYLTYFLPFNEDSSGKIDLYNFYTSNTNESLYFKSKMDYNKIKIGVNNETYFTKYLLKIFLQKSNLVSSELFKFNNNMESIDELLNNNINILMTDYISIYNYKYVLNKDISDLNLITHLNKEYLYTFVKKSSNIFSMTNFPPHSIIGILGEPNVLNMYIDKLLKDLGYQKNIDYTIKVYNNINLLFDSLSNSEINIIMMLDIFPNKKINDVIEKHILDNILLLPFDINNEKVFFQKNSFFKIDYVDLNNFSDIYLPKSFGKYHYNINLPSLKMIYTNNIFITNRKLNIDYGYNFIKYYIENLNYLNYVFKNSGYKLDTHLVNNNLTLKYYDGVIKYLLEKGYISYNNNDNCKYLIGKMECNEKNLKNNNLFYS
jgi:TRAP-type uncharacterized transport system substrate-binding protein